MNKLSASASGRCARAHVARSSFSSCTFSVSSGAKMRSARTACRVRRESRCAVSIEDKGNCWVFYSLSPYTSIFMLDYASGGSTGVSDGSSASGARGCGRVDDTPPNPAAGTCDASSGGSGRRCGTSGTNSSTLAESCVARGGIWSGRSK